MNKLTSNSPIPQAGTSLREKADSAALPVVKPLFSPAQQMAGGKVEVSRRFEFLLPIGLQRSKASLWKRVFHSVEHFGSNRPLPRKAQKAAGFGFTYEFQVCGPDGGRMTNDGSIS